MIANLQLSMNSTSRSGKRRQISRDECLADLSKDLPKFFIAFNKAVKKYNKILGSIPIESRVRIEAPLLNSCVVEELQKYFPINWKWGKYKRFILKLNDYIFLVKKLNNKNKPMNIKTKHVNTISNQLNLSLFDDGSYVDDPILFFGYKKDKMGEIISPQIVYIDEDKVKWVVDENDINIMSKHSSKSIFKENTINMSVKDSLKKKKASNED